MTPAEFESILALGHETNGIEFKGPGKRTDRPFFAKVVRAILSMANRRDGGRVIIGVEDKKLEPVGLSDEELATWTNFDELSAAVNEYASLSVILDLEPTFLYQSKSILIIRIHEFAEIPILCSREYCEKSRAAPILRPVACYVRSRHKPETAEIPSEEEMRELLELAIDKGVTKFLNRAVKTGLLPAIPEIPTTPRDENLFREQVKDME